MISKLGRSIIGLDIRSDTVSAVMVKSGLKGIAIEKTAHTTFTENGEEGNGLASALDHIATEMDISRALCIVSLPFSHLSLRTLEVPFNEPKKIKQILPFELEPALPLPVDEQIIDFITLKENDPVDTTDILIAVIEQNELKMYLDHLKHAGFDPERVTINGHAPAMALAYLKKEENFILADIGLKKIMVYVANNRQIKFIRSFPVPSNPSKKKSVISSNLRYTVLAYEEHFPQTPAPQKLYITGRGTEDLEISDTFKEALHISVDPLDFLKETKLSFIDSTTNSWHAHAMSNPLALGYCEAVGLKGFNFRKGSFANKKFWIDNKADFIKSGILAAVVILMFIAGGFINTFMLERRIDEIKNEMNAVFISTFPEKKLTPMPLEQMQAEMKARKSPTNLFTEDTGSSIKTIDILNEISRSISSETDAKFTKLVYSAGSLLISGNTADFNSVDDMKNRLEKSDLFRTVTISSVNKNRSGKRVEFKLKIDLS